MGMKQLTEEQYYEIKGALDRAYTELEYAHKIFCGKTKPVKTGADNVVPNPGGKDFQPRRPVVRDHHKGAVDNLDPEVQAERAQQAQDEADQVLAATPDDMEIVDVDVDPSGNVYVKLEDDVNDRVGMLIVTDLSYDDATNSIGEKMAVDAEEKTKIVWDEIVSQEDEGDDEDGSE